MATINLFSYVKLASEHWTAILKKIEFYNLEITFFKKL